LAATGFAIEAYAAPCQVEKFDRGIAAGIHFQKPAVESKYAYQFVYPHLLCGNCTGVVIMQHHGTIQTWDRKRTLYGSSLETREPIIPDQPKSTGMVAVLKQLYLTISSRNRANMDAIVDIGKLQAYHS
jgi:hypothetical protein